MQENKIYFVSDPINPDYYDRIRWDSSSLVCKRLLEDKLIFETKEEAILKSKSMLDK